MTRPSPDPRDLTTPAHTETTPQRPSAHLSPARWWERPWILPLTLFSTAFLLFSLPPYLSLQPADSRLPIPESPAWYYPVLVVHVFGGALITLLVILQVWPWLRTRRPAVHRWSGRVYVLAGLPLVGVSAMLIAPFSEADASARTSAFVWAVLWSAFTVLGYVSARRRHFASHREWMLRSFALVYGIAFNRILHLLLVLAMSPGVDAEHGGDLTALSLELGAASGFLSWILPLLFLEWWLKYRKPRRRSRHARASGEETPTQSTPVSSHTP
jgi:hypothetical protein